MHSTLLGALSTTAEDASALVNLAGSIHAHAIFRHPLHILCLVPYMQGSDEHCLKRIVDEVKLEPVLVICLCACKQLCSDEGGKQPCFLQKICGTVVSFDLSMKLIQPCQT